MSSDSPPTAADLGRLQMALAEAGLVIAAFRWRLRAAGYPFREPPNVSETIARIDALVHPDECKPAKRAMNSKQNHAADAGG